MFRLLSFDLEEGAAGKVDVIPSYALFGLC